MIAASRTGQNFMGAFKGNKTGFNLNKESTNFPHGLGMSSPNNIIVEKPLTSQASAIGGPH
jgi:hypothetical protein